MWNPEDGSCSHFCDLTPLLIEMKAQAGYTLLKLDQSPIHVLQLYPD